MERCKKFTKNLGTIINYSEQTCDFSYVYVVVHLWLINSPTVVFRYQVYAVYTVQRKVYCVNEFQMVN